MSDEKLPEWPKQSEGVMVVIHSGDRRFYPQEYVEALRARLGLIVRMAEELIDQPSNDVTPRWSWTDEKWREVIAQCKEPT